MPNTVLVVHYGKLKYIILTYVLQWTSACYILFIDVHRQEIIKTKKLWPLFMIRFHTCSCFHSHTHTHGHHTSDVTMFAFLCCILTLPYKINVFFSFKAVLQANMVDLLSPLTKFPLLKTRQHSPIH